MLGQGGGPGGGAGPIDLESVFGQGGVDLGDLFGGVFGGGRGGKRRSQAAPVRIYKTRS